MRFFLSVLFLYSAVTWAAVDEFTAHIESASNNKLNMYTRWTALVDAAHFAQSNQQPDQLKQISGFSSSKDWYMRNASLLALLKLDPVEAVVVAKKLLVDKSLVVRSAAVEVIAQNLTVEHKKILAAELNKPYNFHKKSSLWIRKQIIEKFSRAPDVGDRDFFVKSLFDSDQEISLLSAKALEKITGQRVDGSKLVEKWQTIVKQNNWL